jgi:hypothetical protein
MGVKRSCSAKPVPEKKFKSSDETFSKPPPEKWTDDQIQLLIALRDQGKGWT